MSRRILSSTTAIILLLALTVVAHATITVAPEPFQAASENSTYRIKFDEVSNMLRHAVVNTGRSPREIAPMPMMKLGTRARQTVQRATIYEGNRFYYEMFQESDDATSVLHNIKKGLEAIPSQVSLGAFTRDEQLAYWLNLYNITLIDEIAKTYPKRNLKRVLVGKKSILDKKTLKVAGAPLSLNDIEFILWKNYNGDPLIVYGLYQGIIGGPNIRRTAYTGKNVYRSLQDNAKEFINSNRGTYEKDDKTFRVSSLYERDTPFFDSDEVLKKHLMRYLDSPESEKLQSASRIKRDINDWTITDLYGTYRDMAGSMLGSPSGLLAGGGGDKKAITINPKFESATVSVAAGGRYNRELLIINDRRIRTAEKNATVTVEELGTVEVKPESSGKVDN